LHTDDGTVRLRSFAHRPFTSALSDWLDATLTVFRKRNTRVFYTAAEPPFKNL